METLSLREVRCEVGEDVNPLVFENGNVAKNVDNQGIIKIKAEALTISARGGIVES